MDYLLSHPKETGNLTLCLTSKDELDYFPLSPSQAVSDVPSQLR